MPDDVTRMPPRDDDTERALLGACLTNSDALVIATDRLEDTDFYVHLHGDIFAAMRGCLEMDGGCDPVTVINQLREQGRIDLTGIPYITDLATAAIPSATMVPQYARRIKKLASRRSIIERGLQVVNEAYEETGEPFAPTQALAVDLLESAEDDIDVGFVSMADVIADVNDYHAQRLEHPDQAPGIASCLDCLNDSIGGWLPAELTIVGARPGQGKSTLARQEALEAAEAGVPVGIISLEMTRLQMGMSLACSLAGVNLTSFRQGRMSYDESMRYNAAAVRLAKAPIYIDDRSDMTIAQVRAAILRGKAQHGIGLWIIDYLQLVAGTGDSENERVNSISRTLKNLTRQHDVPILALSQMNREVDRRPDRRPQLSDLRASGGLEQDADNVLFLFRLAEYSDLVDAILKDVRGPDKAKEKAKLEAVAEIIIAKSRYAKRGSHKVEWDNKSILFRNPGHDEQMGMEWEEGEV